MLNIVKVRYIDPPIFVDVGSIVSSYTLAQAASAGGTIVPGGSSNAALGGSLTFSSSPTITYTPLTGSAYIRSLATPLPVTTVFDSIENGMPPDTMLLAAVKSINGLRNQRPTLHDLLPADEDFYRVIQLLHDIYASDAVRRYIKSDPSGQQVSVLVFLTANITPEVQAKIAEVRQLLHLDPNATELTIVPGPLASSGTEVAIVTRSIVDVLQNMAAQVEVPPEDVKLKHAVPGFQSGQKPPGVIPIIGIHSSKSKPEDPFVSVRYRDTWFWIDDGDLKSKRAFALLMQLFTMADTGEKANPPVVTIPAR